MHLFILASMLSVPQSGPADWPQWGGRDERNFVSGTTGLPATFRPPGVKIERGKKTPLPGENVRWSAPLGNQTYVTPAVAGGRVFMGTNDKRLDDPRFEKTGGGLLVCLDARDGRLLWQLLMPRLRTKNPKFNFDDLGLGICASPTVEGNRVYIVSSRGEVLCLDVQGQADGNDGPFTDEGAYMADTRTLPDKPGRFDPKEAPAPPAPVGLKPTDGDILWRYDFLGELDVWPQDAVDGSILIHGDHLFVCTSNGVDRSHSNVPSTNAPNLIVLDKKTGKLLAACEPLGKAIFHGDWSSPALARVGARTLVVWGGGDGVCYAFDAAFDPGPEGKPGKLRRVWWFDANPPHNRFRAGKRLPYNKNGEGPSEIIATPVVVKDRVYVAVGQDSRHGPGPGCFSCIDATKEGDVTESGKLWQCFDVERSFSSAAVYDGLVFIADYRGILRCLDADTGKEYWAHDLGGRVFASPLVADGRVFIGDEAGRVIVVAAGKEKKVLAEVKFDSAVYSSPVAAGGILYLASQRMLFAFGPAVTPASTKP
jgi:outer membrane protein assembly factor BamB